MAPTLPPEVLLDILEQADPSTLRSSSRIARSFRVPSQYLLHRNLSLLTPTSLKAYQDACGTRRDFAARKLHLLMGTVGEEGIKVLEKAHAMRELVLKSERRKVKAEVLEQKNLAGLTDLRLEAPFAAPESSSLSFPFSLASLTIRGLYSSLPTAVLDALVASSLATLTTLDIDAYGSNTSASTFFSSLLPLAPHLLSLELHGSDRRVEPIFPFLALARRLETFTCWEPTLPLLCALPPSVKTLNIGANFTWAHDFSKHSYEEMLTRSGLLNQLETIEWTGISMYTLKAQRGGELLLAECERRGIEVVFGVPSLSAYGINCT
ncbi:hypothetical protein BCR35DRAFT_302501 [Leucosporidium creatinivorum]|uniref:F-box domain-containing protein n=1 Tax=Leucosporidium creatinivorum TaxID=106004 RepID=A0A1Y2FVN9_9BASI|nr:hypothetical protein BCR35DRAFT_302501 [Leucosporidium creatinivorum]